MKIICIILFFATISLTTYSQYTQTSEKQKPDNEITHNAVAFRLFPTQNMWTFIKLNTRNGLMWQVQYDTKGDNRFEVYLNLESLVTFENEVNDRFTLYPTQNMYNFILLDQLSGKTWQVQWAIEAEHRLVIPIE